MIINRKCFQENHPKQKITPSPQKKQKTQHLKGGLLFHISPVT